MSVMCAATLALFQGCSRRGLATFYLTERSGRYRVEETNRPRSDGERDASVPQLIKKKLIKNEPSELSASFGLSVLAVISEEGGTGSVV